ncbi:MAG: hypothetical protein RIC56_01530 [Pseudomonadales bacterium]
MRVVVEARACSILRNLLLGAPEGTFLLPANVCPVVPLTFRTLDRPFEFIDIDGVDLCMDRRSIEERLAEAGSPPVVGVLYVRTYGIEQDLTGPFGAWKRQHPELLLIDDRCLCRPEVDTAESQGADVVLFSTGYGKYVDLGFGGFALLSDSAGYVRSAEPFVETEARRLEALYKQHIAEGRELVCKPHPGWIPSEGLEISTPAYLEEIRRRIGPIASHKAILNDVYRSTIPERLQLGMGYCSWRFQLRTPNKAALLEEIFQAGQFASGHYYPASRLFGGSYCPRAEDLYADVVNLFNDFALDESGARTIAELIKRRKSS